MAAAVGLEDLTPDGYRAAAANETDPAPADVHAFEEALRGGHVDVLIVNTQTEGSLPAQLRGVAEGAGVPVVEVTETMPARRAVVRVLAGRPAPSAPAGPRWLSTRATSTRTPASTRRRPAVIELRGASVVRGGRTIWEHGDIAIPRGSLVVVIGPNGSGKTTLLQVVLGLLPASSGSIAVLGDSPRRGDRRIGYVPQNYTATIGNAVRARDLVGLGLTGTRWGLGRVGAEDRARIDSTLEAVGALPFAERRMSTLSGGQQQRVAIAQALVGRPELLLLDEPLANLDMRNQNEVVELLETHPGRRRHDRDGRGP